ncbi:MFS transporter [Corynebacterium sp.]|uniref:MFS transporter n=1 Tax=Corynebacterium sp. TaxID=1720 RepID=UPI0026E10ADE|nr:MFS transporter [Corynebacterium sp.]MDO5512008.1 MFS transporter [Corynebacterium sp.]
MSTPVTGSPRPYVLVATGAFLVMVANAIPLSILSIFTPFITRDLGFDTGSFQIYYSLLAVATALAMPLSGRLMTPLGARRILLVGGVISTVGLIGLSLSRVLWHFYLSGALLGFGVGLGCMFVPVVLVNTWFVARRGLAMGVVLAGTGVGGAVMSLLIPLVIGAGAGWRTGFLVLAAIMGMFTIAPTFLLIRNQPSDVGLLPYGGLAPQRETPTSEPGMTFGQAMRSPWFHLFYLMIVLLGIIIAVVQSLSVHLDLIGLPAAIGPLMMIITLGLVFWKIILGVLVDVLGLRWAMLITLGLCAAAFLAMPGTTSMWILVLCMIGISAGTANGTVIPPLAGAVAFGARDYPAIWGVGATAFSVGTAAGTPLWGWAQDLTGDFTLAFRLLPLLIVITIAGLFLAMNRGRAAYAEVLLSQA